MTLDLNVLLFTFGVSVLTGTLFGLIPAISSSRNNLAAALNERTSRSSAGFRSGKIRSVLVISEMALALVLVVGATLLIRTFMKLQSVVGFDSHNVVTMAVSIGAERFRRPRCPWVIPTVPSGSTPCRHHSRGRLLLLEGGFGLPLTSSAAPKAATLPPAGGGYLPISWATSTLRSLLRGRSFPSA